MNQEIQHYHSDDAGITLDVRVENDTVWLTQSQMAQLFSRDISVISRHIRNIFQIGELEQKRNLHFLQIANSDEFSTCKDFLQVRQEGSRIVNRRQRFYNLDMICSSGELIHQKL
jgi:hypothetical protein